jgi:regulator of protease activity HflC (stomatin/prohibitin superfamily)
VVDPAPGRPAKPQHPGQELRDQPSKGQRRRRQPGGDRRDCRLAGRRYLAGAVYAVDDYLKFVQVQAESALRHVATTHPYDDPGDEGTSLRGSTDVVAAELSQEVAQRVAIAGVEIVEVRISHLAYASEIAQAMLRRQQANAVVAARSRIVDGATGMVEMALARLDERGIVQLDEERKAAMVSNLMVVLCADQPVSPVVNAGTLYT